MLYPTIQTLSERENGEPLNRYELVMGVAKSARMVTDEFVEELSRAQQMVDNKETERPILSIIPDELREEKPVHIAIKRIENHEYTLEK